MKKRKNLISESGAIMLEVVAVLSLMGLMGAMLFRQMYVRNQELHNIQMASEIRVVKDAFAAWIQAESTRLGALCPVGSGLTCARVCDLSDSVIDEIKDFLPEGYFTDENGGAARRGDILKENYILKLVGYRRGNRSPGILTYYGVVVPDPEHTLPTASEDGTWNFRRAARVAMLIGVDGGAYDQNITDNLIAGAVGTWNLPVAGGDPDPACVGGEKSVNVLDKTDVPTYVAITGTDVFQPEIDIPDIQLGLEDDWSVATQNLTAYGIFTAGSTNKCYTKLDPRTTSVDASGYATLRSDTIYQPVTKADCLPAFYVEAADPAAPKATGSVHVLNDLTVGHEYTGTDAGKSGMRFDKDGMIVFEKAEENDPQHPGQKVNYMLDPKYTSVMNDIKIMSRGGAPLSQILPNYIIKDVVSIHAKANTTIDTSYVTIPDCPHGYLPAITVEPVVWDQSPLKAYRCNKEVVSPGVDGIGVCDVVDVTNVDDFTTRLTTDTTHYYYAIPREGVCAMIKELRADGSVITTASKARPGFWYGKEDSDAKKWGIVLGYSDNGQLCDYSSIKVNKAGNGDIHANATSYCVYHEVGNIFIDYTISQADCQDGAKCPGCTWDSTKHYCKVPVPTKTRAMDAPTCRRIKNENVCVNMGCKWNAGSCVPL